MNVPSRSTSTLAVVSLICGVLSWLAIPLLGAIVAIITGHMARGEIGRSQGALDGDGFAIVGLILGYLQLALALVGILLLFLFFGGLAFLGVLAQ